MIKRNWTDAMIENSVNAFNNFDTSYLSGMRRICMKNKDGRLGVIYKTAEDSVFDIIDRDSGKLYKYSSIEDVTREGWVVD